MIIDCNIDIILPASGKIFFLSLKASGNFRDSLKDLESEQRRLAKEINIDRDDRKR